MRNVRSVCKNWRNESNKQLWWKMIRIRIHFRNYQMDDLPYLCELYNQISRSNSKFKEIHFEFLDLNNFLPYLPPNAFKKIQNISFISCNISSLYLSYQTLSNIGQLKIFGANLKKVPSHLIASSLTKQKKVILSCCQFSEEQLNCLFRKISSSSSTIMLKDLTITVNQTMKNIDSKLLASAVIKLERVKFSFCSLSEKQITSLLREIDKGEDKVKLQHLNLLCEYKTKFIPNKIVKRVRSKLKTLKIEDR